MINIIEKKLNKDHTYKSYYGGHIMYFKLYSKVLRETLRALKVTYKIKGAFAVLSLGLYCFFEFLLKTPWWLIIKPFGKGFHKCTRYKASCILKYYEGELVDFSDLGSKKTVKIFFLRFLPIFIWKSKLKKRDWDIVLKEE